MMKVIISILLIIGVVNQVLSFECGLEGSASRIYNGKKVPTNKYPWMVIIKSFFSHAKLHNQCVGALIDNQHVITSAQCVVENGKAVPPDNLEVHFSSTNFFMNKKTTLHANLAYFDTHPDAHSYGKDVAILKLRKPVEFSQSISPICLPKSDGNLKELTIAGWGLKSAGKPSFFNRYSSNLMEADVKYVDNEACRRINSEYMMTKSGRPLSEIEQFMESNPQYRVHPNQMCAMNKETGADSCIGDAGAPLMHKNSDGRWVLVGIVFGSLADCGNSDAGTFASFYTRVTQFENEIKKAVPSSVWVDA